MLELDEKIPNNVNLSQDPKLKRALEKWQPNYLKWWKAMGPDGFQDDEVHIRTAISVEPGGWANFDFVKMPSRPLSPTDMMMLIMKKTNPMRISAPEIPASHM